MERDLDHTLGTYIEYLDMKYHFMEERFCDDTVTRPFSTYPTVFLSPTITNKGECGYLYIIIHTENSYMYLS